MRNIATFIISAFQIAFLRENLKTAGHPEADTLKGSELAHRWKAINMEGFKIAKTKKEQWEKEYPSFVGVDLRAQVKPAPEPKAPKEPKAKKVEGATEMKAAEVTKGGKKAKAEAAQV